MPQYNVPSGTNNNVSFGPAIIRMGATGATPTVDVGYIVTDDGVTIEVQRETRAIQQGNPKMDILVFDQVHGFRVTFGRIEWNTTELARQIGTAVTQTSGTLETLFWGGDPTPDSYALQIEHAMAQSSQTTFIDVWTVVADGNVSVQLAHDEHRFPTTWRALRTTTDWAGASLAVGRNLVRARRLLS